MKKLILAAALCLGIVSQVSYALAVLNLEGKLTSITRGLLVLETKDFTYYIKKKAIAPEVVAQWKVDTDIKLSVPRDAIDRYKTHFVMKEVAEKSEPKGPSGKEATKKD